MIFSLLILGSPASSQAANTAYRFAVASLEADHQLYRVFFLDDGVSVANGLSIVPQDETNWQQRWSELGKQYQLDMVVCVSSTLKRGVVDSTEASRYEKPAHNLAAGFSIGGLGQLIDASINSDRVITFGG